VGPEERPPGDAATRRAQPRPHVTSDDIR
jgi:hypothetical protein